MRVSSGLPWADHSSKESYRLCKRDYESKEEARAQQMAVEPLMNECISCTIQNELINGLNSQKYSGKILFDEI
jgi:hypothetical protein